MNYLIIIVLAIAILLGFYELFTGKLITEEKDKKWFYKFLLIILIVMLIFKIIEKTELLLN